MVKVVLLGDGGRVFQGKFRHSVEGVLLGALSLRDLDTKRLMWLQCSFQDMLLLLGYASCPLVCVLDCCPFIRDNYPIKLTWMCVM